MYFWQVISCNLFLNKNVKIAGNNCKIRKTFWCTVKVQWLTTSICWLSKGQSDYSGKWNTCKTCTFGSQNICSVSVSFPMRYCMTLYLKRSRKYERSKLKVLLLLSEFRSFNFDLSYFWRPFRYRVIQYLIGKLSDMVKMIQKG